MTEQQSSSPWEEFVLAAYRQVAVRLREALGSSWFEQGVEPHVAEDERATTRALFEGSPSNGTKHPGTHIERLRDVDVGNWDAVSAGFDDEPDRAPRDLDRLVLIAAEVAVKEGVLPENVIHDFGERGRAVLEGLGSPAAADIERMTAGFAREPVGKREGDGLDEAVEDSFPASDPPAASNPSTGVGAPDD